MTTSPDLPPHLTGYLEVDEEAERVVSALARVWGAPPWRCTTTREAEWLMAKLAAAQRDIATLEADAAEWRSRIDEWLESSTRRPRATTDWASAHLEDWLRCQHEADEKVKSVKLPSGKVTSTAGRVEWVVVDELAAIAHLVDHGLDDLVVTKLAGVQKLAERLKPIEPAAAAMDPDGQAVPGIVIRRRDRTYKATPG